MRLSQKLRLWADMIDEPNQLEMSERTLGPLQRTVAHEGLWVFSLPIAEEMTFVPEVTLTFKGIVIKQSALDYPITLCPGDKYESTYSMELNIQ